MSGMCRGRVSKRERERECMWVCTKVTETLWEREGEKIRESISIKMRVEKQSQVRLSEVKCR